jgi:hypothetical protein
MNTILFLTYGDLNFKNSRCRIHKEACSLNFFDKAIVETEKISNDIALREACKNNDFSSVFRKKRGGGYWTWKPYIIFKHLELLSHGDILIYTDAGSTIPDCKYTKDKLSEYVDIVKNSPLGVLAFRNPEIESKWTKGDVFKHFGGLDDETVYNTRQFSAGRMHVAKKCDHSQKVYGLWWETAKNYPNLFDDSKSKHPSFPNFHEHRHDASNWSLICKTVGVEEENDWGSIPICATRIKG